MRTRTADRRVLILGALALALACGRTEEPQPAADAAATDPPPRTDTTDAPESPVPFDTAARVDVGATVSDTVIPPIR